MSSPRKENIDSDVANDLSQVRKLESRPTLDFDFGEINSSVLTTVGTGLTSQSLIVKTMEHKFEEKPDAAMIEEQSHKQPEKLKTAKFNRKARSQSVNLSELSATQGIYSGNFTKLKKSSSVDEIAEKETKKKSLFGSRKK